MSDSLRASQLLNRLRLRQVALLLALQQHGTLGAAATELGMTQPAATKMLQELETALACRLVEREGRGLRLTPAGQTVLGHFEGLRGAMTALARDLEGLRAGDGGTLDIGSVLAPSPTLLSRAVVAIKREQPRLRVSIHTETSDLLMDQLASGHLDLVIGRLTEGHRRADHEVKPLDDEALRVVVGPQHPWADGRAVGLLELMSQPWVLQPRGSPMREVLEQAFRHAGVDVPQDLVETASILTTSFLLAQAPMVAVLPAALADYYASRGQLCVLPIDLPGRLDAYSSIIRRDRPVNPAARRFLELLHALAPGAVDGG
ncbi:LysR family transcriptional regulator [Ideonella livida]|uniref:LysR family transcriptional regulator n=1 Tax=Ideonella livida TaxID=2707176 RepID=A0A7C9TJK8_9BURK|nr:LysR family transcriptional regulator [Ideonella livida]NDY90307.1 LysR family transcriptional regulator [Ideonella livida]